MNRNTRRLLALALAAAVVGGLIPPDAARAAVSISAGAASEAGLAGAHAGAARAGFSLGAPAAGVAVSPALSGVSLSPAAGPSALPLPVAAPAAASPAAPAVPVTARASAPAAAPALAAASPAAAAEGPAPAPAEEAAPTPAAPRGALARLTAVFSRRAPATAPESLSAAADKAAADARFDGAADRPEGPEAVAAAPTAGPRQRLAAWAGRRVDAYKAQRAETHDGFGGPKAEPMSLAGRVGYGLKTGLNLLGLSALLDLVIAPVMARLPWPLWLAPETMQSLGRVELLAQHGPAQIAAALSASPLHFLGLSLPLSTGMEELTYRFAGFGAAFLLLAVLKPVTAALARLLEQVPDASGFRSSVQSLLVKAGAFVSYYAFPLAAAKSAFDFATAHFALWGVNPVLFELNLIAGYILARTAYKTRGLTAPFVAHLTFNLAMVAPAALTIAFAMPGTAEIVGILTSVLGLVSLWWSWRASRKAAGLKARWVVSALVAALLAGSVSGSLNAPMDGAAHRSTTQHASTAQASAPAPKAQDPAAPVAPAAASVPDVRENAADMIARVKPSVLKIIVQMDQGMAIGSGVIITPEGLAVTNGHVVGDRVPGQTVLVDLVSGQRLPAKVVAVNHDKDLALIQLPRLSDKADGKPLGWPTSPFATQMPREGEEVFAMGHPLNLPFTVTRGIVSGKGMRGNMYVQYLQTDASINHGNSGGPLYNSKGEVVGINTMIMGSDGSIGLGFSIISPAVQKAVGQYLTAGNINTAAFGVIVDLSNPDQPDNGVAVEYVRPGSAAAKAGLRRGDVIIGLGGVALTQDGGKESARAIAAKLAQSKPGDALEVAYVRGDSDPQTVKLVLDAKTTSEQTSAAHGFEGSGGGE